MNWYILEYASGPNNVRLRAAVEAHGLGEAWYRFSKVVQGHHTMQLREKITSSDHPYAAYLTDSCSIIIGATYIVI